VRECANHIQRLDGIDVLINNAGIVSTQRKMSVDGFELTFATNYLGPFLLTQLILDRVRPMGRIVNVASRAHFRGRLDLDSVTGRHARYNGMAAYARSKLANVLHTLALARRLSGTRITANCLHPGVVATNLLPRWLRVVKPFISPVIFDAERGAQTTMYLALSPEVGEVTGRYFDENQREQPPATLARDVALQDSLWNRSEGWVSGDGLIADGS
jgi:NAD(P)-dependent dehydrogenase (short-subunit alcohol dehydrogenase family)